MYAFTPTARGINKKHIFLKAMLFFNLAYVLLNFPMN